MSLDNLLREGAVYDQASETWTRITDVGAPEGRAFHAAVWTGCSLIVWGGAVIDDTTGGSVPSPTGGVWGPL